MTTTTQQLATQSDDAVIRTLTLSRGLDRLGNWEQVGDNMYEYYDDAMAAWYVCHVDDICLLGAMSGPDVYSHWCAQTSHEQVAA